jgi:phospholipid/cholesterol/gamma-HCH transport system substrate-binding protein
MAGKTGVLGAALGSEDSARKVLQSIDRANTLLASLNGVALKMDSVLAKTDQRVLSTGGVVDETQKAVTQANAILGEVRASLKRVDNLLADAEVVAGNTKAATADLGALRAEVEASLRKIATLIEEINRKWPFGQDTKIKLP